MPVDAFSQCSMKLGIAIFVPASDQYPLNVIETRFVAPAVIELGGASDDIDLHEAGRLMKRNPKTLTLNRLRKASNSVKTSTHVYKCKGFDKMTR